MLKRGVRESKGTGMELPDRLSEPAVPTLQTLAMNRPRPGLVRMTSMLNAVTLEPSWDEDAIATWLQFPGCSRGDYTVRRYDAERGIIEFDLTPGPESTILNKWLDSLEVGSLTRLATPDVGYMPNFAAGRRVLVFADESSISAVHAILAAWPDGVPGTMWLDTRDPSHIADLPVVAGVGIVSFHVDMGFDPLVTAARRVELDSTVTVWAAGEARRMDAIRAACLAAGLPEADTRIFGYWADSTGRRRR